jgi:hypothetical protein
MREEHAREIVLCVTLQWLDTPRRRAAATLAAAAL